MAARRLLTIREAAQRIGMRESTLRAWVLHRKLVYYKINRGVRIDESDLERMIEQARIPARQVRTSRNEIPAALQPLFDALETKAGDKR
jgi:excisionase family DNA binding protein